MYLILLNTYYFILNTSYFKAPHIKFNVVHKQVICKNEECCQIILCPARSDLPAFQST